ncbi:MAG: hypothetical protein AAF549_04430 [Pseudomonadota bacterium]
MIEVNASITSFKRQEVRLESSLQRAAVQIDQNANRKIPAFSNQENQIADDVSISTEAIQQLQETKALADQLQFYLDYLQGRQPNNVLVLEPNGQPNVTIDVQSAERSATISVSQTEITRTNISATFSDEGELLELELDQIRVSEQDISVELQNQILNLSIQA